MTDNSGLIDLLVVQAHWARHQGFKSYAEVCEKAAQALRDAEERLVANERAIDSYLADETGIRSENESLQARVAELEGALRYIAEFAHPDFPADDLAGELDRAEKIWLQFQNVASFALKD